MGLTERHLFENEDVPENYEWALEDAVYKGGIKMSIEEQQKYILEYLRLAYVGARAFDDLDTMTRLARAIEAFELPVSKDAVIACKEGESK